ncbi:hypothetical protein V6N12_047252 [Hibiscus sabdariffa]|uniref:Uncharacterized protein n=1 Tax=Hibiscus sabdariffa TaxID=183260 RepID=A0ABR2DAB9_9ROSI
MANSGSDQSLQVDDNLGVQFTSGSGEHVLCQAVLVEPTPDVGDGVSDDQHGDVDLPPQQQNNNFDDVEPQVDVGPGESVGTDPIASSVTSPHTEVEPVTSVHAQSLPYLHKLLHKLKVCLLLHKHVQLPLMPWWKNCNYVLQPMLVLPTPCNILHLRLISSTINIP